MRYGSYALTAMLCMVSVSILLIRVIHADVTVRALRVCKRLIKFILLYSVIDIAWSIVADHVDTFGSVTFSIVSGLNLAMSGFVACYLFIFSRVYLEDKRLAKIKIIAMIPWMIQIALLVANFRNGFIYTINDEGRYTVGPYRIISFAIQFFYFGLTFFYALISFACAEEEEVGKRSLAILAASLLPCVTGAFQVLFPEMPVYSAGFLLLAEIIYAFVLVKDIESKDEKRIHELDEKQQDAIRAFVQEYVAVLRVKYNDDSYETVAVNPIFSSLMNTDSETADFRDWCNKTLVSRLHQEDVDYFLRAIRKDEVLHGLEKYGRYSFKFRLMSGNNPVYYAISFIHSDCNDTEIFVSLANVDSETRREHEHLNEVTKAVKRADSMQYGLAESRQVLNALARNYRVMFIINLVDFKVAQVLAGNEYDGVDRDETDAEIMVSAVVNTICNQENFNEALKFVNLSQVADRLEGRDCIKLEAKTKRRTACNFVFMRMDTKSDGKPSKVVFAVNEDAKDE